MRFKKLAIIYFSIIIVVISSCGDKTSILPALQQCHRINVDVSFSSLLKNSEGKDERSDAWVSCRIDSSGQYVPGTGSIVWEGNKFSYSGEMTWHIGNSIRYKKCRLDGEVTEDGRSIKLLKYYDEKKEGIDTIYKMAMISEISLKDVPIDKKNLEKGLYVFLLKGNYQQNIEKYEFREWRNLDIEPNKLAFSGNKIDNSLEVKISIEFIKR
jgi:hypothetical protein